MKALTRLLSPLLQVKLILGVGSYGWYIGALWPLFEVYFSSSVNNKPTIVQICNSMGINLWWFLQFMFSFYSSSFVATLVGVDMFADIVIGMRKKDGMYKKSETTPPDRNFEGITSLCELYTPSTALIRSPEAEQVRAIATAI